MYTRGYCVYSRILCKLEDILITRGYCVYSRLLCILKVIFYTREYCVYSRLLCILKDIVYTRGYCDYSRILCILENIVYCVYSRILCILEESKRRNLLINLFLTLWNIQRTLKFFFDLTFREEGVGSDLLFSKTRIRSTAFRDITLFL